jgi:hypothetical protein
MGIHITWITVNLLTVIDNLNPCNINLLVSSPPRLKKTFSHVEQVHSILAESHEHYAGDYSRLSHRKRKMTMEKMASYCLPSSWLVSLVSASNTNCVLMTTYWINYALFLSTDSTVTTHADSIMVMGQIDNTQPMKSIPYEIHIEQSIIDGLRTQVSTTQWTLESSIDIEVFYDVYIFIHFIQNKSSIKSFCCSTTSH